MIESIFFLIVFLSMKKKQKKHLIETNEWNPAFSQKLCPFLFFSLPSSISLNIEVKNHFEEKNLEKSSLSNSFHCLGKNGSSSSNVFFSGGIIGGIHSREKKGKRNESVAICNGEKNSPVESIDG
jgi:hypothetical protein